MSDKKSDNRLNKERSQDRKTGGMPFSVLLSLYIKEKPEYFLQCMESILNQTVMPTEIVVVKDGPVDGEVERVLERFTEEYPGLFKIISYEPNRGLGYALARGVEACGNEIIARMDTDDIARRDRFERQLREFAADPELDICGSVIEEFEEDPGRIVAVRRVPLDDKEIKRYQRRRDGFNHMTVMFKRAAVLKAGNYKMCPLMEDSYLWVRMMKNRVKCKNISEPLVYARIGKDMYERRGGVGYFLKYRAGRRKILGTGYISLWDYSYTLIIQFIVALAPGSIRKWIFKLLLHRRESKII